MPGRAPGPPHRIARRAVATALLGVMLAGCGSDPDDEAADKSPVTQKRTQAEKPAEKPATPKRPHSRADRVAAQFKREFRKIRLSGMRGADRREVVSALDEATKLKTSCSKTAKRDVYDCSASLTLPGYAPGLEQWRVTGTPDHIRAAIPQ